MRKISAYFVLYLSLIGCFILGAWFIWRGLDALTYVLAERKMNASEIFQSVVGRQSGFIAMGWAVSASLVLLIVLVYAESYFRKGAEKGQLIKRIARIFGILLILIFSVDLISLIMRGWTGTWIYWLVMTLELAGGVGLVFYSKITRGR